MAKFAWFTVVLFIFYFSANILASSIVKGGSDDINNSFDTREMYREKVLLLAPEVEERLAKVSEIMTLSFIIIDLASLILDKKKNWRTTLSSLLHTIRYLLKTISSPSIKRQLLPRVSDQTSFHDKMLAKYRIDLNAPWADQIFCDSLNDPNQLTSSSDLNPYRIRALLDVPGQFPYLQQYFSDFLLDHKPRLFFVVSGSYKIFVKELFKGFVDVERKNLGFN